MSGVRLSRWLDGELEQRRMSQRELARVANLASSTVSKIIKHRFVPEIQVLYAIADALEVSRETVLEEAGVIQLKLPDELPPELRDVIRRLANLPDEHREFAVSHLEGLLKHLES